MIGLEQRDATRSVTPKGGFMLNEEQINSLFAFCGKHCVRYYDVQVELVDHLANAIEEVMEKQPQLSFEKALELVYAGFGPTGFAGIVNSHHTVLDKKCRTIRWTIFRSCFTWPGIAKTACVTVALFCIGLNLAPLERWYFASGVAIASSLWALAIPFFSRRLFGNQTRKLLLTQAGMYGGAYWIFAELYMVRFFFRGDDVAQWTELKSVLYLSCMLAASVIGFLYARAHYDMCKQLRSLAKQQYPAAF